MRYGLRVDGNTSYEMMENTRAEGFGKEVKRRILLGTYALSAGYYDEYYGKALQARKEMIDEFTINAGLIINKKPVIGVVYAPAKKRLFYTYGPSHAFEIVNNKEIAFKLQKELTFGQALTTPSGGLWRWDGFF